MNQEPPASVGMPLADVETPALLIDLDAFESNLDHMAATIRTASVALRPHAKSHKCPTIGRLQMARGAVGLCCQKVSEAEAMVHGGIPDVLVTNEIVDARKARRLATLAGLARVGICVDSVEGVAVISAAAADFDVQLRVLVEINVGQDRCGVAPGQPAADLARAIDAAPGLVFDGLQAYHGSAQHFRSPGEREDAIAGAAWMVRKTIGALSDAGLSCNTVTGAGTGTFPYEMASGVYTEIQAGSYVFMDVDYCRNLGTDGLPDRRYAQSLSVLSTVISRPTPDRAVVDAGTKAMSVDSGLPEVRGHPDWTVKGGGDEHTKILLPTPETPLAIGEKILFIPGHCDPTVNMYDWYVGIRNDRVESLWPIAARGPGR